MNRRDDLSIDSETAIVKSRKDTLSISSEESGISCSLSEESMPTNYEGGTANNLRRSEVVSVY